MLGYARYVDLKVLARAVSKSWLIGELKFVGRKGGGVGEKESQKKREGIFVFSRGDSNSGEERRGGMKGLVRPYVIETPRSDIRRKTCFAEYTTFSPVEMLAHHT